MRCHLCNGKVRYLSHNPEDCLQFLSGRVMTLEFTTIIVMLVLLVDIMLRWKP